MGKGSRNRAARRAAGRWVEKESQDLQATCAQCGLTYETGARITTEVNEVKGEIRFAFTEDQRVCPSCGRRNQGVGRHITHFEVVQEGARLVARLPRQQLAGLLTDVMQVQSGATTPEQLAAVATDDTIRRFWDLFPRKRSELYAFVAMIATVLTLLLQALPQDEGATPEQLEQILETVMREAREAATADPPAGLVPPAPSAPLPASEAPPPPDPATSP